ncbi:MAG: hypothetical protein AAF708_21630 [Deinococcota bacterium]
MDFPATTIVTIILVAVSLGIWTSVSAAISAQQKSVGVGVFFGLSVWFVIAVAMSHSNYLFRGDTPIYILIIPLSIAILVSVGLLSFPSFRKLIAETSQIALIAPHMLRIVGFSFLILGELNYLPKEFTIPAGYGDIISGVLVLPVIYLILKQGQWVRSAIVTWNIIGIADFVGAFIAGPRFIPTHLSTFAQPYALNYFTVIPIFVVPLFVVTHIYSIYKVVTEQNAFVHQEKQNSIQPIHL